MLWIRDILAPLTYGSGTCSFCQGLQDAHKNIIFFPKFFCLLLFEGTFPLFFKDNKSQYGRNQGFSFFCLMIEGSGSVQLTMNPDPGGPKTDPDPPHLGLKYTGPEKAFFYMAKDRSCTINTMHV